jgi:hypothetical protein
MHRAAGGPAVVRFITFGASLALCKSAFFGVFLRASHCWMKTDQYGSY